jgi:nucleotide-binding universal stress UspA family protein
MASELKHFLVPLDGSRMAEAALPVAVGLARPLDATITLLHVQERDAPRTIHGEPHLQEPPAAEAYLTTVAETWRPEWSKIDWHVHPNEQHDVAKSISEHAREMGADVVVLTTHGHGGLRDLLFGSIAQQVVRQDPTPTLVVRPPDDGQSGAYRCASILVPLDGTHDSERALDFARQIAVATGARIMLASVIPTVGTASGDLAVSAAFSPGATAAVLDLAQSDAGRYLEGVAAGLRGKVSVVRTDTTRGKTAPGLAAVAAANAADLVILATHGRSGLRGALSGSVAPRLLAEVRVPVLLVRVPEGSGDPAGSG